MMSEVTHENSQVEQKITMYATSWCGDCRFAKRWFDSHSIAYDYIDIEQDDNAAAYVVKVNHGRQSVPTIVFPDGSILVEPDARALAEKFPDLSK
jgi:mycoredoxin